MSNINEIETTLIQPVPPEKIKYTTYLAGAIEHVSAKEMKSWRQICTIIPGDCAKFRA